MEANLKVLFILCKSRQKTKNKKWIPIASDLANKTITYGGISRVRNVNNIEIDGITINNIVAKFNFLTTIEEEKDSFNKRAAKNTFKAKYPALSKFQPDSDAGLAEALVKSIIKSCQKKIMAAGIIIAK